MVVDLGAVFVTSTGKYLPGDPVDNDALDRYIAPLDGTATLFKRSVLADNGIKARHYAIDEHGNTRFSCAHMAAEAARACLASRALELSKVGVLCTGSSAGDLALPGFANMVQGELGAGPMHTSSHQGVCASGVAALQHAASALTLGEHQHALVVASELPSRLFKRSRFAPRGYRADFDAHFLRFMLSDGAGALLLGKRPCSGGVSLRLDWVHTRSFSGDHPVCMQLGSTGEQAPSYLDYASLAEAEQAGACLLRQDTRLLPRLFELGVHEYVELIRRERIDPRRVDHLLCHYSSAKFAPVIARLMREAGFEIPAERWYSSLERRGNTGSASIFIMLDDLLRERSLTPGQRILCFVPESGRFTVAFAQLTVVDARAGGREQNIVEAHTDAREQDVRKAHAGDDAIAPPAYAPSVLDEPKARLIAELSSIWHDYQSRLRRTPLLRKLSVGSFTREDYLAWMSVWIPQVRCGSQWMRRAKEQLREPFLELEPLIASHASDEQDDYAMLFEDYKSAGGEAPELDGLRRNAGGEALNAFMFRLAERPNPVDLLGAVHIIEGTGQRVIPQLLPSLRRQLRMPERSFRFLRYHGENDEAHLARWLDALSIVLAQDAAGHHARAIARTARATAELYLLQFQYVLDAV